MKRGWWVQLRERERTASVFWLPAVFVGPRYKPGQPRRLWGPYPTGPAADRAVLALRGEGWTVSYHDVAKVGPIPDPASPPLEFWAKSPRSRPPKPTRDAVAFDAPTGNPIEQRRKARRQQLERSARRAARSKGQPTEPIGDGETVAGATITIADGRVHVRFPYYLSAEQYARVHDSGFYWSASRQAFSRKHSDAALHAARTIAHDVEGIP